jgi:Flp pilus assembly protein TadB
LQAAARGVMTVAGVALQPRSKVQELTLRTSVIVAAERRRSSMSASHDDEHRTVAPTQQARQGVTGHNVRYVLGFGLIGVIVVFAVVYAVYLHE